MSKKVLPIRYTSRNFDSIKNDLLNYAKKYYPDTYQDFNQGSFGSLMFDTVAYVGDIMSFYLDYQANESFIDTAIEYDNIIKLGGALGYKQKSAATANGIVTLYISLPANSNGTSFDEDYLPIIKQGTVFKSTNGNSYTLVEDVIINEQTAEIRASKINEGGPFQFVAKVYGKVISGVQQQIEVPLGDFIKYRKVFVGDQNVTEILSVTDSNGHVYYEVDYLTQNIVYMSVPNYNSDSKVTPYILKPISVARRFVVLREANNTYIQFGASEDDIINNTLTRVAEPTNVVLELYGKPYVSDKSFDPTLLIGEDKLGSAPYNTTLTITFRRNERALIATPAASINSVILPIVEFKSDNNQQLSIRVAIQESLRVTNNQPIIGTSQEITADDLRIKINGAAAMQNRAVTAEDYKTICYIMPQKYGSIKRASVIKDINSLKKNLNLYVMSEDSNGNLQKASTTTKENLKNWIIKNKMINDTIDILDAKVVNFGIYFTAVADRNVSKYQILSDSFAAISNEFSTKFDIGEALQISRVYEALRRVEGLLDVRTIRIVEKNRQNGTQYSDYSFNFEENMTEDEMYLKVPKNVIMELKFPDVDIEGKIL